MKQPNDSRQRAKMSAYVALMRAWVAASIGLLWSGAHQFGVRWNTVRWPTVLAISVIACTAIAKTLGHLTGIQRTPTCCGRLHNSPTAAPLQAAIHAPAALVRPPALT